MAARRTTGDYYRHTDAAIARLDERVDSLNSDLSSIRSDMGEVRKAVSELAHAFTEKAKTQWQPLLTAGALIIAIISMGGSVIWALSLSPINEAILENRQIVRSLPESFIPRAEIEQRWKFSDQRFEWLKERVDKLGPIN